MIRFCQIPLVSHLHAAILLLPKIYGAPSLRWFLGGVTARGTHSTVYRGGRATERTLPTHAGRTEPLAEPSLMAFMAGCSSNGCSEPRVERWTCRGWAFWTFGSVHAGPQAGWLCHERGRWLYRAPAAMERWSSESLEQERR